MSDEIDAIRARHEAGWGGRDVFALMAEMNDDRATLLQALLALREENERLRGLLEQCHQFFGEMYSNGVCLPQAGEQALDRVSSRVSAALTETPNG